MILTGRQNIVLAFSALGSSRRILQRNYFFSTIGSLTVCGITTSDGQSGPGGSAPKVRRTK